MISFKAKNTTRIKGKRPHVYSEDEETTHAYTDNSTENLNSVGKGVGTYYFSCFTLQLLVNENTIDIEISNH